MAYLVIAIGALMALTGGYLVNYGYAIVQVERGWSSVIAGAVFLTGGLLAMALGLLLRAIVDVRRSLVAGMPTGVAPVRLVPAAIGPDLPMTPPFGEPAARSPLEAEPSLASLAFEARAMDPAPHALDEGTQPDPSYRNDPRLAEETAFAATTGGPPPGREPRDASHAGMMADQRVPEPADASALVVDDWLDRAFSDLDREAQSFDPPHPDGGATAAEARRFEMPVATPLAVEPAPPPIEPVHVAERPVAPAPLEPAHPDPMPDAPPTAPEPTNSPVIGRYQSDDTSYVMYADGSIEAQSQAGVYRFASMAELKAFIEG